MEQFNNQNPSLEEALVLVNNMFFPQAVVGDKVNQFGYWFELTETGWVPTEGN